MRSVLLAIASVAFLVSGLPAQNLPDLYAPQGRLILTRFASAPFPHPNRTEGHKYKDQFFSAAEHYSDNTVALFVPKAFRETGRIDLVIHFHGWKNHVEGVLQHYKLIEQLVESGRNAVLIVPQGPHDAPDSFGGKLEDVDGFKRFIDEVAQTLREKCGLKQKDFVIGDIVLSGHSGGYQVISAVLDHGGSPGQIKEVWLFDALYAQTDRFLAWSDRYQGRWLDIYTEHGGTKEETENLMALLKQRGTPFWTGTEGDLTSAVLETNRLVFIYTDLAHDDVVDKHSMFRQFLQTSAVGK